MVTPIRASPPSRWSSSCRRASPIKGAADLAAALRPMSQVTFAGGSAGGVDHILAALFAGTVGVDGSKVNYVPFAGGGEALARHGGRVTAGISGWGEFEGQVKAGTLRAIAITAGNRVAGTRRRRSRSRASPRADQLALHCRCARHHARAKKALADAVDKTVKSSQWQDILKQRGWDDAYLPRRPDDFTQDRAGPCRGVLKSVGLVK